MIQEFDLNKCSHLAFVLPDLEGGGAERAIVALANKIVDIGGKVDLVLGNATGPYIVEVSKKINIINLSTNSKLSFICHLILYLKSHKPSVVMSSMDIPNFALIIAASFLRYKGRIVLSQRATIAPVYAHYHWISRWIYNLMIHITFPKADSIICNSFEASSEINKIVGKGRAKVVTIHNSVDAEKNNFLANKPLINSWYESNRLPLILSVGSLTQLKDRETLIRAFAIVRVKRNARLAIVGKAYNSKELNKIENLISELGLNEYVYLAGFDVNPFQWMKKASVLVSSSITEGCPNQLLEGLSIGIPIVATDCPGGTADILEKGKWGKLVPIEDPECMAAAIIATLDDHNLPNGKLRANDFSPSKNVYEYLKILLPC